MVLLIKVFDFFFFRKKMASILDSGRNLSISELLISIWEYSKHVHHNPPPDPSSCNCCFYLDCCIEAARTIYDHQEFILFDNSIYKFQFQKTELNDIMPLPSLPDQTCKKFCIELILRDRS